MSVDGTCLDLADTQANERYYGRPGTATELKSDYPQARVLGLVECATHAVIGAVVSGVATSEHDLYPGLLHRLEADMLAMADRGFFSYTAWKDSAATGAQLLWRVKANAVLPVIEDLADAYAKRWEIESCFDERGPATVLRSKTPDGVLQEIYGHLCVHYAIRSLIGNVAHHFDEDPLRFSFTRTLRAARRSLAAHPAFSP